MTVRGVRQERRLQGALLRLVTAARLEGATVGQPRQVGRLPRDRLELAVARLVQARNRAQQTQRIGVAGPAVDVPRVALLDDSAGVHHVDPVGVTRHYPQIVRNEDKRHAEAAGQGFHQLQDLGLDGDVERGGRLVGNDQRRFAAQRHGNHHALAHAAAQVVRILPEALPGLGNAHHAQVGCRSFGSLGAADGKVLHHGLGKLQADAENGIERGHGLLKDHGDLAPAHRPHVLAAQGPQVLPPETNGSGSNASGRNGEESENRQGADRLAAPRFADQRDRFTLGHVVRDAIHGTEDAPRGVELDSQILDFQQFRHTRDYTPCRGHYRQEAEQPGRGAPGKSVTGHHPRRPQIAAPQGFC